MSAEYADPMKPWHQDTIDTVSKERDDAFERAAGLQSQLDAALISLRAERAKVAKAEAVHAQWVNELLSNEAVDRAAREMEKPENDNGHDRAITCIMMAKRTATGRVLQGPGQPALEGSALAQVEAEVAAMRRERDEARASLSAARCAKNLNSIAHRSAMERLEAELKAALDTIEEIRRQD